MKIKDINHSYSLIQTDNLDFQLKLMNLLSVYVPGYQFTPQYKSGVWDGKYHFYKVTPHGLVIPKGLVDVVINKFGHTLEEPYTPIFVPEQITEQELDKFIKTLNLPFEPRDYQKKAILTMINNPRGIILAATNSGKSLVIYMFLMFMYKQSKKSVLIVPNVSLVEQMYSDFKDYKFEKIANKDDIHIIYAGKEKHFEKPITITTWQSVYKNKELFEGVDCIVVDEAHLVKGESLQNIIQASINAKYKWGLTGTLPDDPVLRFMAIGALGKPYTIVTPKQLIEMGYATPVFVNAIFIEYNDEIAKEFRKECKTYQQEVKWIENNIKRNKVIIKLALKLIKKNENVLMLYNKIAHGELLLKLIMKEKLNLDIDDELLDEMIVYKQKPNKKLIQENKIQLVQEGETDIDNRIYNINDYNVFFVRGDVDASKREDIRNILENKRGAILIATYKTLSTGVNIKNLHHLFFTSSTKSFVTVNQSIGRGMRQHKSKEKVYIWDFIDDLRGNRKTKNYMLKHFDERVNYYLKNGYEVNDISVKLS